ncbi:MAG TPA: 2-amino-4-hydroxy-6-hydroxymethyldihydropteridine diphosphokinase, partial [Vicinamibacterales bacterium]|nr:2-amino-4-hydroxy-6-hydroxymethyldihydropteridine diphosphokinase [Vicinamibacterales bacterium]
MDRVAIAFGSNLGDRAAALAFAAGRLAPFVEDLTFSTAIETEPQGEEVSNQPLYLNAVAVGRTSLDARALLELL